MSVCVCVCVIVLGRGIEKTQAMASLTPIRT